MLTANVANTGVVNYTYDGEGRRVQKTVGNAVSNLVYDASGQLVAEYFNTQQPVWGTQYVFGDHLGSTRLVTKGTTLKRYDYLPFGEELPSGVGGRGSEYGAQVVVPSTADVVNQKFTGKERDAETGLDFFQARYYSGAQGRFSSPDKPFLDQTPSNPQSWNLYSYTRNNPLKYTDPTGRCSKAEGGYTDKGSGLFPGPCSGGTIGEQKAGANSTTVGVGQEEAYLIMLQMVGEKLSSPHQIATVVGGAGVDAAALWGFKGLFGLRSLFGSAAEELIPGLYGNVSRAALEAAVNGGGETVKVVTNLTQAPAAGRALSAATGEGAEAPGSRCAQRWHYICRSDS